MVFARLSCLLCATFSLALFSMEQQGVIVCENPINDRLITMLATLPPEQLQLISEGLAERAKIDTQKKMLADAVQDLAQSKGCTQLPLCQCMQACNDYLNKGQRALHELTENIVAGNNKGTLDAAKTAGDNFLKVIDIPITQYVAYDYKKRANEMRFMPGPLNLWVKAAYGLGLLRTCHKYLPLELADGLCADLLFVSAAQYGYEPAVWKVFCANKFGSDEQARAQANELHDCFLHAARVLWQNDGALSVPAQQALDACCVISRFGEQYAELLDCSDFYKSVYSKASVVAQALAEDEASAYIPLLKCVRLAYDYDIKDTAEHLRQAMNCKENEKKKRIADLANYADELKKLADQQNPGALYLYAYVLQQKSVKNTDLSERIACLKEGLQYFQQAQGLGINCSTEIGKIEAELSALCEEGKGFVIVDDAKAYEQFCLAVRGGKKLTHDDYCSLGASCCRLNRESEALEMFGKAGEKTLASWYRALTYLRESKIEEMYAALESALYVQDDVVRVSRNDIEKTVAPLVELLLQRISEHDMRAQVLLVRLAFVVGFDAVDSMSEKRFLELLTEAVQAKVATAQSFLGYLFRTGQLVQKSNESAEKLFEQVLGDQAAPAIVRQEAGGQQLRIALLFKDSSQKIGEIDRRVIIRAGYFQIPYQLRQKGNGTKELAIEILENAEANVCKFYFADQSMVSLIKDSGTYDLLVRLAKSGDRAVGRALFIIGSIRLAQNAVTVSEVESFKNLFESSQKQSSLSVAERQKIGQAYRLLADGYSREVPGAQDAELKEAKRKERNCVELARNYDPENRRILLRLGIFYLMNKKDNKEGVKILEKLANNRDASAQFALGKFYSTIDGFNAKNKRGNQRKAITYLTSAVRQGNREAIPWLPACLLERQDIEGARTLIGQLLSMENIVPEDRLYLQGVLALAEKKYEDAINYFDQQARSYDVSYGAAQCVNLCFLKHDYDKMFEYVMMLFDTFHVVVNGKFTMFEIERVLTTTLANLFEKAKTGDMQAHEACEKLIKILKDHGIANK